MLRKILILTVSVLSLQSMSYAADSDKPMSDTVSAITLQSVVAKEIETTIQNATTSTLAEVVGSVIDQPEVVKVKKTAGEKIKSFFANLFVCLRATTDVVKDVTTNVHSITKDVQDIRNTIGSMK